LHQDAEIDQEMADALTPYLSNWLAVVEQPKNASFEKASWIVMWIL
jgi:hypothetical protein